MHQERALWIGTMMTLVPIWPMRLKFSVRYCGEGIDIGVDQAGGELQEYVEDCQVCCQPLNVRVIVDRDGSASVMVNTLDEG